MIISVRVIPRASRNLVKEEGDKLKVYLTKPAQEGLANHKLIELLSEHFKIKKYNIKIIKGLTSREKLVEING
ncbi:MAG: DUF167 domain-containing protein [Candidatus Omnitrophica bacterium]|nr:DUF167 domain-containing protein [Candidatus Omnitrophota bacterium]